MLEIQQQFIDYNRSSRSAAPVYIVIHDTGDTGATAQNEHDYFAGGNRGASADYFVDSDNIIQIIDTDNYYSWHCGDGAGAYGITNRNSLGIEMCLDNNGAPTDSTLSNTIDLVKYLMDKYSIGVDNVVRHYDASRKSCPGSLMDNDWSKWDEFKQRLINENDIGWNKNSNGWWYCTNVDGSYYTNSWQELDGEWYSFDSDGYARQSVWLQDGGKWYYLKDDCKMARNEWLWIGDKCYCFDSHGVLYQGITTPDGYKVGPDGAWIRE